MKYLLFFILFFNFGFGQNNIDFATMIKNQGDFLEGKLDERDLKVRFNFAEGSNEQENNIAVNGTAVFQNKTSNFTGKISFSPQKTNSLKDPTIHIFECQLNFEGLGDFEGSLAVKIVPKIFNVVVFEGVLLNGNTKSLIHFDNSKQVMTHLESLKK